MSYILCLGLKSTIYKKNPVLRLFINNYFIDEFSLDLESKNFTPVFNHPRNGCDLNLYSKEFVDKFLATHNPLSNIDRKHTIPQDYENILNEDIILRFFEINKNIIDLNQENKIILEVLNDDNNYSNGFLTKSTFVSLNIAYLIPKQNIKESDNFLKETDVKRNILIKKYCNNIDNIKNYYKTKAVSFDLIKYCIRKNSFTFTNNKNKAIRNIMGFTGIGETGQFQLCFKNDLLDYDLDNFKYEISRYVFLALSNKYKQYENQ